MSGRFYDPNPVYFDLLSNAPVAGGSLAFYEQGTTTPKGTWSDQALTIPNTNPVPLDSSGRANVNIWLDGAYSVRLLDSLGAVSWTRDVNDGAATDSVFPTLQTGKFLSNDGSSVLWADLIQLPDPTGSDGKMVVASGGAYVLQAQPEVPESPVVVTANSIKTTGENDVLLDQWGTGSIPASGTKVASVTIPFPVAYTAIPNVTANIARGSGVVPAGFIGCIGVSATATSVTIAWDLNVAQNGSEYNLSSPIPVTWRAIGKVAS